MVHPIRVKAQGFSLPEILIVIVIVGILVSIAHLALRTALSDSKTAKKEVAIKRVMEAKNYYYLDNKTDPGTTAPDDAVLVGYLSLEPGVGTNALYNGPESIFKGCFPEGQDVYLSANPRGVTPTFIVGE